jgi:ABC-type branched-subunit amino acid transport system ATPase component
VGVAVEVEGLTKSFGSQNIWSDVTLTLPPGEISVLLGPSGTGKSVFLKSLVGLLKPEQGSIVINDVDIVRTSEHELYEVRKLFGVLFLTGDLRQQYEEDPQRGGIVETYQQVSAMTRYEVLDVGLQQVNDAQDTATLVVFGQYVVESVNSGDAGGPRGLGVPAHPGGCAVVHPDRAGQGPAGRRGVEDQRAHAADHQLIQDPRA